MYRTSASEALLWNDRPEDILFKAQLVKQVTAGEYEKVANIPLTTKNFETIVQDINAIDYEFAKTRDIVDFYRYVHPDRLVRNASDLAAKTLLEFRLQSNIKEEIFNQFTHIENEGDEDVEWSKQDKRFIQMVTACGKLAGLHLIDSRQRNIEVLRKKISEVCTKFCFNLQQDATYLRVTASDLDGLPPEFIASLEKDTTNQFKLMLKYHHFHPVMSKCKLASTRKSMEIAFHSRCKMENSALLTELVNLRQVKARLMGFESHAAMVLHHTTAKHPDNVYEFLSKCQEVLMPCVKKNLEELLELKRVECENDDKNFDEKLNMWDIRYYNTKLERMNYANVIREDIRQYFPLNAVITGLFKLTQDLLQLKFERVEAAPVWHNHVTMYSVSDQNGGVPVGYFYLDLVFRPGKYRHISSFSIVPNRWKADGSRQNAVGALTANFLSSSEGDPPLLYHDEVVSLFREFGKLMGYLCVETEYEMFSKTCMERDFVDVPGQVFECWCWEAKPLQLVSRHYKDQRRLPLTMIENLVKSRIAIGPLYWLRQIMLAKLDLNLHTDPSIDMAEDYNRLCEDMLGIPASCGTFMPASFVHPVIGYDAMYYSYLWSKVCSFDMFYSRFKLDGLDNPHTAKEFREKILSPGGSVDSLTKFKNFVGRPPSLDAFLNYITMDDLATVDYLYQKPISDMSLMEYEDKDDQQSPLLEPELNELAEGDDSGQDRRSLYRRLVSPLSMFESEQDASSRVAAPADSLLAGQTSD